MKGIPNAQIAAYVRQDVEKVLRNASVVIHLTNADPIIINNETPRLQVIAVIGPGYYPQLKLHFSEAVLLEIGIGYSYSYHETKVPKALRCKNQWCESKLTRIRRRHQVVRITAEQYLQIAPLLFAEMQRIVNRRIAARKKRNHLNPPYKPVIRLFHSHRKSTLFNWGEKIIAHPGSRFSVSALDEHVLSDVYWLEQQTDTAHRGKTEGLAHRIAKRLSRYARNGTRWRPEKLKGLRDVDDMIENSNLPVYKRAEVLRLIKDSPKRRPVYEHFRNELELRLGSDDNIAPETRLIRQTLPHPEERLSVLRRKEIERHIKDVERKLGWDDSLVASYRQRISSSPAWNNRYQIQVTTGLGRKDCIVFEMSHSLPTETAALNENPSEHEEAATPAPV